MRIVGAAQNKGGKSVVNWTAALVLLSAVVVLPAPSLAVGADGWGDAELIGNDPRGNNQRAQVAVDDLGRGLAIWELSDGLTLQVYASRYTPDAGWQIPERLWHYGGGDASDPDVAMDANGNGVAVWTQVAYGTNQIALAHYTPGVGWGAVQFPGFNTSADQRDADVAVSRTGDFAVVWSQCCDPGWQVWGIVFDRKTGWTAPGQINVGGTGNAAEAAVGMDQNGGAIVVWHDESGPTSTMNGSAYTRESGWGLPVPVETTPSAWTSRVSLAVDASGNALAAWERYAPSGYSNVAVNHYTPEGGWERAELIGDDTFGSASMPRVAMDGSGNGMVVWHSYTASKNTIGARSYDPGRGWGPTRELENVSYDEGRASPDVSMDAAGNAVAVWVEGGAVGFDLKTASYSRSGGWSVASYAEAVAPSVGHEYTGTGPPRMVLGEGGHALVTWSADDRVRWGIWANAFRWPDVTAPSLSLLSPGIGVTTNQSVIQVSGLTEVGARVSVNGVEATVAGDGSFSVDLALQTGTNFVVATAQDAAGNRAEVSTSVTFDDPRVALENGLAQAQLDLAAAEARAAALAADANATAADLDGAEVDLVAAKARVTSLESSLSATAAALAANNSRLATVEGSLADTNRALAETQAQLAAARSEFNATKTTAPASGDSSAMGIILGAAGIALGALGVALALRARRTKTVVSEARPQEPSEK